MSGLMRIESIIYSWLILQQNSTSVPTLIYFHGNAGSNFSLISRHWIQTGKILAVDYRGYGNSTGTPSEAGLMLDADATINYVANCNYIDNSKIILFGKSLGGAVAVYLSEKYPTRILATILENTFTTIGSLVDQHMPHLKYVKYCLLRNNWNSLERIKTVKRPTFFIYGDCDEIIDNKNMIALYKNANKCIYKDLYVVHKGDHNQTYVAGGVPYYNAIRSFIEKVIAQYSLLKYNEIDSDKKITHEKVD